VALGETVKAKDAVGWLIDYAGPTNDAIATAWKLASGTATGIAKRPLEAGKLSGVPADVPGLPDADGPQNEAARAAIVACMKAATGVTLAEALPLQAKLAAEFLASATCKSGRVGAEYARTMVV